MAIFTDVLRMPGASKVLQVVRDEFLEVEIEILANDITDVCWEQVYCPTRPEPAC